MSDYDPLQCLEEEVKRFFDTNHFTPMLVTNFYAQARIVIRQLKEANEELESLRKTRDRQAAMLRRMEEQLIACEEAQIAARPK